MEPNDIRHGPHLETWRHHGFGPRASVHLKFETS